MRATSLAQSRKTKDSGTFPGGGKNTKENNKKKTTNNSKKISKLFRKSHYIVQLSCRQTLKSHNNVKILKKNYSKYTGRIKERKRQRVQKN